MNWVRSETGAADGGYANWSEGTSVKFWWEITTVKMTCMNWVRSETGAADGGYANWSEGTSVKFWWFDGRDLTDNTRFPTLEYDKIQSKSQSLKYTYSGAMYALLGSTLS